MEGEIRYNTRSPAGCVVGDGISTYLTVQLCTGRGKAVPEDHKFVFREVRRFVWLLNPVFEWQDLRDYLETNLFFSSRFRDLATHFCRSSGTDEFISVLSYFCIFRMERCTTLRAISASRRWTVPITACRRPRSNPAPPASTNSGSLRRENDVIRQFHRMPQVVFHPVRWGSLRGGIPQDLHS